jgi:hypothetical protein
MMKFAYPAVAICLALTLTPAWGAPAWSSPEDDEKDIKISAHHTNPVDVAVTSGSTGPQSPAISFHGGPVMSTPNVYLIWYGNWAQANSSDTAAGKALVTNFLAGLSGSSHFKINTTYNNVPSGSFIVAGAYNDSYSQGTRLSDSRVQAVVNAAIAPNKLPKDSNGVYFVLTSSDVSESSGFCSKYCGWHTYGTIQGSNIKYSFVGNANRCLSSCSAQTISPNVNAGVDGMISVLTHELEETVTDPNLNGWYDANGAENGDKCAWTFGQPAASGGPLKTLPGGAAYNLTLNGLNFLVQRNLQANNSQCYVSLNGAQ